VELALADTEIVASPSGTMAVVAVEQPHEEQYKSRKIGIASWIAMAFLAGVVIMALIAPLLPIPAPSHQDFYNLNAGMGSPGHLLGTDQNGVDVLSNVVWGAQASLLIGVGSILVGVFFGGLFGLIAGYRGGKTDTALSTFFNIFLAFPQLILALTLVAVFAPNKPSGGIQVSYSHRVFVMILAIGLVSIPILGRITRANALAWSQREFVTAAKAQGAPSARVMFREVLPNVLPAMLSIALLGIAVVIVLEGALAIFGLSVPSGSASWGSMINSQLGDLSKAPAFWLAPSIMICLTVLSLNYLGDVVRSRFDVRESAI
jgi:peptide/nickel transport system permease protein